ncbi:MAG: TMEM165/GDT1 family protein [Alphaproteobacteria bacterium]|nr:TMEM165/GDT1 family protein [Alphaproteobacteria bacterium]
MLKLLGVFAAVFLAELGDKTQIAVLVFAAAGDLPRIGVFLAASAALLVSTGLAVVIGGVAGDFLTALPLKLIAGLAFIAIGALYVIEHFRAAAS